MRITHTTSQTQSKNQPALTQYIGMTMCILMHGSSTSLTCGGNIIQSPQKQLVITCTPSGFGNVIEKLTKKEISGASSRTKVVIQQDGTQEVTQLTLSHALLTCLSLKPTDTKNKINTVFDTTPKVEQYIEWDHILELIAHWIEIAAKKDQEVQTHICNRLEMTLARINIYPKLCRDLEHYIKLLLKKINNSQLVTADIEYKKNMTWQGFTAIASIKLSKFFNRILNDENTSACIHLLEKHPRLLNILMERITCPLLDYGADPNSTPKTVQERHQNLSDYYPIEEYGGLKSLRNLLCTRAVTAARKEHTTAKAMWSQALKGIQPPKKEKANSTPTATGGNNPYKRYLSLLRDKSLARQGR